MNSSRPIRGAILLLALALLIYGIGVAASAGSQDVTDAIRAGYVGLAAAALAAGLLALAGRVGLAWAALCLSLVLVPLLLYGQLSCCLE